MFLSLLPGLFPPPPISVAANVEGTVIKHEKFYLNLQFIVSLAITLT